MTTALAVVIIAFAAGVAPAEGTSLRFTPGKWKTTTTMRMPMLPQPQTRTATECLREGDYSAERLMRDQQGCQIEQPEISANTIRWTAKCPTPEGPATGTGEFTVLDGGTRGRGTVRIDMQAQGQAIAMTMDFESERVGDCD